MSSWKRSEWRKDDRWNERLERDQTTLRERLSDEQIAALDLVVNQFEDDEQIKLSFVVVFGSQATGETHDESDLDIYAEANIPKARGFRVEGAVDFLIHPNNTLMGGSKLGLEMTSDVVAQALIWHDDGSFRSLLIWLDEQEQ